MRETVAKRNGGRAHRVEMRTVIPGIVRDAQRLGVSRYHLWAVLSGRRESPRLMARYGLMKSAN